MSRLSLLAVLLAVAAMSTNAAAQETRVPPPAESAAAAEALFNEGRRLLDEDKVAEACVKFEESLRLDPVALGTQLNLAACYKRLGRTASAWSTYLAAAAAATHSNQPQRAELARNEAAQLEATLTYLTVDVAKEAWVEGLEITRDGVVLGRGQWGTAIPVDPGPHTLEAVAPGMRSWQTTVHVQAGTRDRVAVPVLVSEKPQEAEPPPTPPEEPPAVEEPPPPEPAAEPQPRSLQRWYGVGAGAAGVVGIGVGVVLGLSAKSKADDADCDSSNRCSTAGLSQREDAVSQANLATIVTGIGAALAATGVVLWLTAPEEQQTALAVGVSGRGLTLGGTW